jgi:hypothetical protein
VALPQLVSGETEENHKYLRIAFVLTEFRTEHFLNTSQELYRYVHLLSKYFLLCELIAGTRFQNVYVNIQNYG